MEHRILKKIKQITATAAGVVFGDITANDTTAGAFEATPITGAPDH